MAKAGNAATTHDEVLNSLLQMNKAAQRLNLSALQTRGGAAMRGVDVCKVYAKVKPVLEMVSKVPLLPKKIREAIILLMSALDTLCPV